MQIAEQVGGRATCLRRHVGAVLVKDKRILATGYNGPPSGVRHCEEVGCLREQLGIPSGEKHELCRGIHAEQNAVIQAAKHGIAIDGGDGVLHPPALPHLREDPAERRRHRDRVPRALSRSALRGASRRGRSRASAVRAVRGGRGDVSSGTTCSAHRRGRSGHAGAHAGGALPVEPVGPRRPARSAQGAPNADVASRRGRDLPRGHGRDRRPVRRRGVPGLGRTSSSRGRPRERAGRSSAG